MNAVLPIVFLMFLVCLVGNSNGIQCYFCPSDCSDPFNKTAANTISMLSPTGWCMKFKSSEMHKLALVRSPAPIGLCTKNKCKSANHKGFTGTACCCNTDLCNNSNTIAKSLSSFIGLAFITGMNVILNY